MLGIARPFYESCSGYLNEYYEFIMLPQRLFDSLPVRFQMDLNAYCHCEILDDGILKYTCKIKGRFENLQSEVGSYIKRKCDGELRLARERECSGLYTEEDLCAIREIQGNRCYYTGSVFVENSFTVDHITPISSGGSFWPQNIALTAPKVNSLKCNLDRNTFFRLLTKEKGKDWVVERKRICKVIDKERREIDRMRKVCVKANLSDVEKKLSEQYQGYDICYQLVSGDIVLNVSGTNIAFFPGFIREKRYLLNVKYLSHIISVYLNVEES